MRLDTHPLAGLAAYAALIAAPLTAYPCLLTAGLAPGLAVLAATVAQMIVIALVELVLPARPAWELFTDRHAWNDIAHGLLASEVGGRLSALVLASLAAWPGAFVAQVHGGALWPTHWPVAVQFALALVSVEILFYWQHRAFHRRPLWRLHALHHDADRMHVLKAGRLHAGEIFLRHTIIYAPMVLAGAPPAFFFACALWINVAGNLAHANLKLALPGILHCVLVTPGVHHLHHARDRAIADTNFSATFPILDLLFGTYCDPERVPLAKVGVEERSPIGNLLKEIVAPFFPARADGR